MRRELVSQPGSFWGDPILKVPAGGKCGVKKASLCLLQAKLGVRGVVGGERVGVGV
jgi:hypothetical protein